MACLEQALRGFQPIGLAALKDKAELMDRRDNKYVLDAQQLASLLNVLKGRYDILEIDGQRQFSYVSTYFDSAGLHTHRDHNQGRRRRIKVRHRHYVDSQRHYLEVKIKGRRKKTIKQRVATTPAELLRNNRLHPQLQDFCQRQLAQQGYPPWPYEFLPSIRVYYQRITLVACAGDERITIDHNISFAEVAAHVQEPDRRAHLNQGRWVVEVKSGSGRTATDLWLLRSGIRPAPLCSKYGMGINLLRLTGVNNRFSAIMRRYFAR